MKQLLYIFLCLFLLASCGSKKDIDARWAQNRNVAGKLSGKTVVYTIFVDSKETLPWSGFDIQSTKDTLNKVYTWIGAQAQKYGANVEIVPVYATSGSSETIKKKLPYSSISAAFSDGDYSSSGKLGKWADGIIKKLEKDIKLPNNEQLPKKPKLDAFHKVVTKLKKIHSADNVVIFFMVNNYFIADASAVLNTMQDEECEFAINSGKYTSLLAAQFLSLFGAQNLSTDLDGSYVVKNIELAKSDFPNDIMTNFNQELFSSEIGSYTAFLIGWRENLDTKYIDLLNIEAVKKKQK